MQWTNGANRHLVIVGGGPAGFAAAVRAKQVAAGARVQLDVTVIEQRRPDGFAPMHDCTSTWGSRLNPLTFGSAGLNVAGEFGFSLSQSDDILVLEENVLHRAAGTVRIPVTNVEIRRVRESLGGAQYFQLPHVVSLGIGSVERVLRAAAEALGVRVLWGSKVIEFSDLVDHTCVSIRGSDGEVHDECAWLVVVADGGGGIHKKAVQEAREAGIDVVRVQDNLLGALGVDMRIDSPDVEQFILARFRRPANSPAQMSIRTSVWNGIESARSARFDLANGEAIIHTPIPACGLSANDKLAWLGWRALEHGLLAEEMTARAVEFSVVATRAKQIVVRNRISRDGFAGAKLLLGRARAATTQLNGAGFQVTGFGDALALGALLRRVLPGGASLTTPAYALKGYEVGRQNVARRIAKSHHFRAPRAGVREVSLEEHESLEAEARKCGFKGDIPTGAGF